MIEGSISATGNCMRYDGYPDLLGKSYSPELVQR